MTRLLISVRNAAEARTALAGGADLIDIKCPERGSLGAADPLTWLHVQRSVGQRLPLSVALGELQDPELFARAAAIPQGIRFAKCGLAGCRDLPDWSSRWSQLGQRLPAPVALVGVAYADWKVARAPQPCAVLARASDCDCRALLLDTWDKQGPGLTEHLSLPELRTLVQGAQQQGMLAVLAGSVRAATVPDLLSLEPDFLAVRGAVCRGNRSGPLELHRVRALRRQLSTAVA